MAITAIKDFKIKEAYTKLVEKALFSYLWEGIYKPMFEILDIKSVVARNSLDVITEALREGKIYYADGGFKAKDKFTNAQSLQLQKWGAVWDKREKMYRLPQDKLPDELRVTLAQAQINAENQIKLLQGYIDQVEFNIPYIVESMVFDNEVKTILDDAGNEIKKNVKHLNIIEPELSDAQKQEIARTYTENVRGYVIKDFANERIPEMRRKIQELILKGYRLDKVQELLQKEYGIMSRKAKFLAQNETTIMLAEYKKVTYKEMGFDKFIWRTITDGRERDLHKALNGTVWRYDDPPVIDERTGQKGLPGQTYNCRCEAIPYHDDSPFSHDISNKKAYEKLLAKNSTDNIEWITVKGNHIPIKKGQTKEQAVKEFLKDKRNEVPVESGIGYTVKKAAKDIYKSYKEANCESTEPAYQYPKTVAGVKRGRPMTFKEADNGRANPYFDKYNYAYSHNCQSCVVAHEARIRGYNVQAAPRKRYDKTQQLAHHSSWAWIDPKTGKKCEYTRINAKSPTELKDWLNRNIEKNARYQFAYNWADNTNKLHGHTIILEKNKDNELQLYDPQINKIYTGSSFNSKIKKIKYSYPKYNVNPRILRIDNKKLNPYFMNDVVKKY